MTLGEKLRVLREAHNLMQRQVGALIDAYDAFISRIENNDKPINRKYLKKFSKRFKVNLQELETLWLADKIQQIIKEEQNAQMVITEIQNRLQENRT
jgi:transcriptional regulator with XRE-family HTH domain